MTVPLSSRPRILAPALAAWLAIAARASAAPMFEAGYLSFDAGSVPASVAIADFDRDGRLDVAVSNAGSHDVSVMLGDPALTLGPARHFATGFHPYAVVAADFDRDGRLDLATANWGSESVTILIGLGNGTFRRSLDLAVKSHPRDLAVGDYDGNGTSDLAVASAAGWVSILAGRGDGTFTLRAEYPVHGEPWSIAVADLDGNGPLDLAVVTLSGYVAILHGNGDGTFRPGVQLQAKEYPVAVAIADLDADGHPDLMTSNNGEAYDYDNPNAVSVFLANGDGTFQGRTDYLSGVPTGGLAVGDLDGDGRLDLIATAFDTDPDRYSSWLIVFPGNGDGTFRSASGFSTATLPSSVAIGDVNADGKPDLVVTNEVSENVSVLPGNGDGTLGGRRHAVGTPRGANELRVADLDANHRPDLVVATYYYTSTVSTLLGVGPGTFAPRRDNGTWDLGISMDLADIDSDGLLDLAVAHTQTNSISVMLGHGDGTFELRTTLEAGRYPETVVVSDFDSDGRQDLAATNYLPGTLTVWLGTGGGAFGPRRDLDVGPEPRELDAADINADGRPDLLLRSGGPRRLSLLLGKGDGSFQPQIPIDAGASGELAVSDLDGDLRLDLAVIDQVLNSVRILLGEGDGRFGPGTIIRTGLRPSSVAIVDLDGDAIQDLAVTNSESQTVSLLIGKGDGTFRPKVDLGPAAGSVAAADFDGDGRQDLALIANSTTVTIMLNQSPSPPRIEFDFEPATLNAASLGRWVTGVLTPSAPRSARDIDIASIRLNGVVPVDPSAPAIVRRRGRDSSGGLVVKFDRAEVARTVTAGERVPITVTGELGDHLFAGTDTIRVVGPGIRLPVTIEHEAAGGADGNVLAVRARSPASAVALRLEITLPDAGTARLDLLDVAGRVVSSKSLGPLGPGSHELELGRPGTLRPGIYFVRLRQGRSEVRTRVAVVP